MFACIATSLSILPINYLPEITSAFHIMAGMGQNLVNFRLEENQTLIAEVIHRLFCYKTVWLLPSRELY